MLHVPSRGENLMNNKNKFCWPFVSASFSIALMLAISGCSKTATQDQTAPADQSQNTAAPDQPQQAEASGNLVQTSAEQPMGGNYSDRNSNDSSYNDDYDSDYNDSSYGQPALYSDQPPPELPEYQQPEIAGEGYIWTPGYWSYGDGGYYWVPRAWVQAPEVGYLWTPGYWAYYGNRYRFHSRYWGRHMGYYGGINYGFGYVGIGYQGGYWNGDRFNYNRSVNNVTNVSNVTVYNRTV